MGNLKNIGIKIHHKTGKTLTKTAKDSTKSTHRHKFSEIKTEFPSLKAKNVIKELDTKNWKIIGTATSYFHTKILIVNLKMGKFLKIIAMCKNLLSKFSILGLV